jgi:hypothetical protein
MGDMKTSPTGTKQLPGDNLAIHVRGTGSVGPWIRVAGGILDIWPPTTLTVWLSLNGWFEH